MEHFNETNDLIVRVLSGDATEEEKVTLQAWIDSNVDNLQYFKDVSTIWEHSERTMHPMEFSAAKDWPLALTRIKAIKHKEKQTENSFGISKLLRIAASILVVIGVGYAALKFYEHSPQVELVTTTEIKKFILPDGSQVVLNTNTTLTYPEEFQANERIVSLEGEAFFEVTKDTKRPFFVRTSTATTEVLGTSFSVNTVSDSVVVTVVTGQVALYKQRKNGVKLSPGDRGVALNGSVRKSENADVNFLSWKTNVLEFRNETFEGLSHDISRHFKVSVILTSEKLAACTITARFENQTMDEIFDELKLLFPISLSTKGDTVLISGEGCGAVHH